MRRHRVIAAVLAVACVFLIGRMVVGSSSDIADSFADADWRLLVVGLAVSMLAVWNRGLLGRSAHRAVGLEVGVGEMTRTAAVGFSAQKIVRSGGASGLAVFVHHGRRRGFPVGSVTASCVMVAAASFVALGALVAAATGLLAIHGRLAGWWVVAVGAFAVYAVAVPAMVTMAVRRRSTIERLCARTHARLTRVDRPAPSTEWFDDLATAASVVRRHPRRFARVLLFASLGKLSGAALLWVAAQAAGAQLTPSEVLIVYATALGASLVSIVPGGLGVVEASTAALLVAGGVSAPSAALVVALFRVFDLWVPLAIGAAVARAQLRMSRVDLVDEPPTPTPTLAPMVPVTA